MVNTKKKKLFRKLVRLVMVFNMTSEDIEKYRKLIHAPYKPCECGNLERFDWLVDVCLIEIEAQQAEIARMRTNERERIATCAKIDELRANCTCGSKL